MADDQQKPGHSGTGGMFFGSVTAGGDVVGGNQHKIEISQGDRIFGALEALRSAAQQAPIDKRDEAAEQANKIAAEAAKGPGANDSLLRKMLEGFVALVPAGASAIVGAFANPVLGAVAGPLTKELITRLRTITP